MTTRILGACSPGEVRVAVVRDEMLMDYGIWRPGAPDGVGDVYRGRVIAKVPAMAGTFVAVGDAEGFLPDSDGGAGLSDGDGVTVRDHAGRTGRQGSSIGGARWRTDRGRGPCLWRAALACCWNSHCATPTRRSSWMTLHWLGDCDQCWGNVLRSAAWPLMR